jgi:serine protease Do
MNSTDSNSKAAETSRRSRYFGRPALMAIALISAGALGFAVADSVPFASAETASPAASSVLAPPPPDFVDLAKKVTPAVVSINVKGEEDVANDDDDDNNDLQIPGMPDIPKSSPFYQFFKRFGQLPNGDHHEEPMQAQGSGFFISPDGYIVTNNHVIEGANQISVTLEDGSKYKAKLIGTDPRTDIALIKVIAPDKTFPYVQFSDQDPQVGEWVMAVGNPFGLGGTVTAGIISAHNRDIGSGPYDYLQIDAAVNRGNSGGPSFTLDGKVVGMNTAIYSPSGGSVGIAFDIPAKLVKEVVSQLEAHGSVERGWLGVVIQNVTDDIADGVGLDKAEGALVTKVSEDGPAAGKGIKAGDVIIAVNGEPVKDSRDLARKIADLHPHTKVTLSIVRYGDHKEISLELGSFPNGKKLAEMENGGDQNQPENTGKQFKDLGLSLAPASQVPGAGNEGVVITNVDPDSDAANKGLKAGDVILQVGGADVSSPDDVSAGIKKAMTMAKNRDKSKVNVIFRIKSGDRMAFIALSLKKAA